MIMTGMKQYLYTLLTTLLLSQTAACGGGSTAPEEQTNELSVEEPSRIYPLEPLSCELSDMRQWVQANMLDYYLFYDQVSTPRLADYNDLNSLLSELRVKPFDQFSYITDAEQATAQFDAGQLFGFGQLMLVTDDRRLRVSHVYPGSSFYAAGIERGDYLLTINNKSPFELTQDEINGLYGIGGTSVTLDFGVQDNTGSIRNLTLTSGSYAATTVVDTRILEHAGSKVGYLAFTSFLETSRAELDTAFTQLQQENVSELILDLRYNRGGRVGVANKLASMILGNGVRSNTFITVALNEKYKAGNISIPFSQQTLALDLNRVIVLTTESSCSASELVINSLRPFMEVILIGQTTCGKPYGSLGRDACGKQMNALEFEFVNASNVGGYYAGINTDCAALDDLDHALGDPAETMLAAGLNYVATTSCQHVVANRQRSTGSPQTQPWREHEPPGISDMGGVLFRQ